MKIVIQAEAFADLERIFEWIARDSPTNARSVSGRISRAIYDVLAHNPFMGRIGSSAGTREWVVRGLPYIIIYEVNTSRDVLIVRAIYHGAQDR